MQGNFECELARAMAESLETEEERKRIEIAEKRSLETEEERKSIEIAVKRSQDTPRATDHEKSLALSSQKTTPKKAIAEQLSSSNHWKNLSEDEQLVYLTAISEFETSGKMGSTQVLDIAKSKPEHTLNLGGDLELHLDDGRVVELVQHCFVLCLREFLKNHGQRYSDQQLADLLSLDTRPATGKPRGEPFSDAKINDAAVVFQITIEVHDVCEVKKFDSMCDSGLTMKLWLEFGHYVLIVE